MVVAIFGESHARKHCEMEVRNLVDAKVHGFYTGRMKESLSGEEGEASDIIEMDVVTWGGCSVCRLGYGQKSDAILLFEDHVSVKRKLEELSGATICRLSNFVSYFVLYRGYMVASRSMFLAPTHSVRKQESIYNGQWPAFSVKPWLLKTRQRGMTVRRGLSESGWSVVE